MNNLKACIDSFNGIFAGFFSFNRRPSVLGLLEGDESPRKGVEMMKEDEVKDDVIRQDHKYVMAERLCRNLLEKGLINQGEFDRIMAKNRDNFSPLLAVIES